MKKYLYGGLAFVILMLSGCGGGGGSNDKVDRVILNDEYVRIGNVKVQNEINNKEFDIVLTLSKDPGPQVTLSDFNLEATGCQVRADSLAVTPSVLTMKSPDRHSTLHIQGEFTQACRPTDFLLTYHNKVVFNDRTKEGNYGQSFKMPTIQLVNNSGDLTITYPDQQAIVDFEMIENGLPVLTTRACGVPDGGLTTTTDCIMPEALPREFGRIEYIIKSQQGTAEDGIVPQNFEDGYVYFRYRAPAAKDMPIKPKSYDLKFYYLDKNGTRIAETTMRININPKGSYPGYQLINQDKKIYVTQPNEHKYISVELVHSGLPVSPVRPCNIVDDPHTGSTVTTDCILPAALPKEFGRIDLTVWPQQDDGDPDATDGINGNAYVRFPYIGPDRDDMPTERKEHNLTIYYVDKFGQRIASTDVLIVIDPKIKFGPVASLSLSYNNTQCIKQDNVDTNPSSDVANVAKMIFVVRAVDKYGNPARAGLTLWPTLINGVKVVKSRVPSGILIPGKTQAIFRDTSTNFALSDVTTEDNLIILPSQANYDQNYLGHWPISDVAGSTLILGEPFLSTKSIKPLTYVVGNERRYIEGYGVAVASISRPGAENGTGEPESNSYDISNDFGRSSTTYITDENGFMTFEVHYDFALAGRTFTLAVNAYDVDENGTEIRAGISKIDTFRWPGGYTSSEETISNDGKDHNVALTLMINGCDKQPLEYLSNRHIVPNSIIIKDDKGDDTDQCQLVENKSNFLTDNNGQLKLVISTKGNTTVTKNCTVKWNESDGGIYMEY